MLIKSQWRIKARIKELKKVLKECKKKNNHRLWCRIKSILLYFENKTAEEISNFLGVGFKSVYRWLNNYNQGGVEKIYEGIHTGRPVRLNKEQFSRLEEILDSGPVAYGLTSGIWTCPTVQYVIEEEFNITYHHDHVRKILHKLGFSVQDPRKKLVLADKDLQQRWIRETYPTLKKTSQRKRSSYVSR